MKKRGVALYMVLMVLLVVIIFANIILSLISSQSTLTHHQTRRVQAYYAAQAGINYALEALRLNETNWTNPDNENITHYICRANTGISPCNDTTLVNNPRGNITEASLPSAINYIKVSIGAKNVTTGTRSVTAMANYSSN